MALTQEQKDIDSYAIACAGYDACVFDNPKFADFFWAVMKKLEKKYGDSEADSSQALGAGNPGDAGWSW